MPVQDSNVYPQRTGRYNDTTGVGPSLVCNAYACEIHKQAGSFGALGPMINCADTQNRDVVRMQCCSAHACIAWLLLCV